MYTIQVPIERQEATFEDTIWFYLFPPDTINFNKIGDRNKILREDFSQIGSQTVIYPSYQMIIGIGRDVYQYR